MRWPEVRAAHPDPWLVIEALDAHSAVGAHGLDGFDVEIGEMDDGFELGGISCEPHRDQAHPKRLPNDWRYRFAFSAASTSGRNCAR